MTPTAGRTPRELQVMEWKILQTEQFRNVMSVPANSLPTSPCLSVVMPAFNEQDTIDLIIPRVLAETCVAELVVVDDCSRDGTWAKLSKWKEKDTRILLVRHEQNKGKGAALRTGFERATQPYVIVQDADMEYDPAEYEVLLQPLLAGKADAVFGSRFSGGPHRVLYYWHAVGNRFLTMLSNMTTNLCLTDMETCYKVFRRGLLTKIHIEENRFGFEPEITAKIARTGARVYEIPISYNGRTYTEGKKIGWRDGFSALRCILKYGFTATREKYDSDK